MKIPNSPTNNIDCEKIGKILSKIAIPGGKYLEVGVFRGMTLTYMIENSKMEVTGVDRWKTNDDYKHDDANIEELEYFYFWLQKELGTKARLIRSDSLIAAKYLKELEEKFDLIFIDADHRYENVKKDIEAYFPLVKNGGIFAGHDFLKDKESGVNKAVFEFIERKNLKLECAPEARIWYVKKEK